MLKSPKEDSPEFIQSVNQTIKESLPDSADKIEALYMKNRTITISCQDKETADEIMQNQTILVEKINKKLGQNDVDRIRYLL